MTQVLLALITTIVPLATLMAAASRRASSCSPSANGHDDGVVDVNTGDVGRR